MKKKPKTKNNTKSAPDLSAEQQKAVDALGEGPVCVSAGAGSGKTRVLVGAYLKAVGTSGVLPENVLAVTFTKKAAYEMKERLEKTGLETADTWIGTIDSFCTRILRENPVECGVDPSFTVLSEAEAGLWMRRTLDAALEEEAGNALWTGWTAGWGEEAAHRAFRSAYSHFCGSGGDARLFEVRDRRRETGDARAALTAFARSVEDLPDKKVSAQKLAAAAASVRTILEKKLSDGSREVSELSALIPDGETQWFAPLKAPLERYLRRKAESLNAPYKAEFRRLFFKWKERYDAEKRRLASHDFNDLLFLTHAAFSGEGAPQRALLRRTREQFRYILVDEFQDTSRLQIRILDLLKRPDNFFIVGDIQQSIYSFRQADPDAFRALRKTSKVCALRQNYRSRAPILEFVNSFFKPLLGEDFQPLLPAGRKKDAGPCLELIRVPQPKGTTLDEARVREAATLARRIAELVREGFAYRDIAVLMRATTNAYLYEKELEELGIPYYLQKSRNFYEQHEIQDLLNFLRLLEDDSEQSDVAAAAVLRSPLVQLSDEGLFWLGNFRHERNLAAFMDAVRAFGGIKQLSPEDRRKLEVFSGLLERARRTRDGSKVSEILETLVGETCYEAALLARSGGSQALANVRKLIDMAAQADEKISGAKDFVDRVKRLSEETAEGEARLAGEKEDVVRLLTVHSAKGLEFPIVFVADMGGQGNNSDPPPPFLMDPRYGFGARWRGEEGDVQEDETYASIAEANEALKDAELLRLLYVAMTRAQDKLILSGAESSRASWMNLVLASLGSGTSKVVENPIGGGSPAPPAPRATSAESAGAFSIPELEKKLQTVIKPYESLEDLTVTALTAQAEERAGAAFVEPEDIEAEPEMEEELLPRNEYGSVFHRVMELAVRIGRTFHLPEELWERLVSALGAKERDEMKQSFEQFWKTPLGHEIKKASKRYPEIPFIFKTRHGLLKGQIDLVFQNDKKEWIILDYKTNRFSSEAEKNGLEQKYHWQLGLYALAFWKLYGTVPARTLLYFSHSQQVAEKTWNEKELRQLEDKLESLYRAAVSA